MDFDAQASTYNKRTGFPDAAIDPIAAAICDMIPGCGEARVLELGAGTGTIGLALSGKVGAYIGMDRSGAMLAQAADGGSPAGLSWLVADADQTWPIRSGSVQCFFTSRALHLFDLDNVIAELRRTADPAGATFLLGRVERERNSVQSEIRGEMRRYLRAAGHRARDGSRAWQQLESVLLARNGKALPPRVAARWTRSRSPAQMLSAWENKPGLGGLSLPDEEKSAILARLRAWATRRFDDLNTPCELRESYILRGVSFNTE